MSRPINPKPTLLVLGDDGSKAFLNDDGSKAILNEVFLLDWLVWLFQNVAKRKVHWLKQRL